jgi:hypothetical protein
VFSLKMRWETSREDAVGDQQGEGDGVGGGGFAEVGQIVDGLEEEADVFGGQRGG